MSPVWSAVPSVYMPAGPRLLLGDFSLQSAQTVKAALAFPLQVWGEKTLFMFILILTFA